MAKIKVMSPVLQGIQTEVGNWGSFRMTTDTKNATGFAGFVIVCHIQRAPLRRYLERLKSYGNDNRRIIYREYRTAE